MPLRSSDHAITTSSPATEGAPHPCPMGAFHSTGGPFVGHACISPVSGEVPSPRGPWNCAQSAAETEIATREKAVNNKKRIYLVTAFILKTLFTHVNHRSFGAVCSAALKLLSQSIASTVTTLSSDASMLVFASVDFLRKVAPGGH